MTESPAPHSVCWPWFAGGLTAPLMAALLATAIPYPLSFAVGFFVAFAAAMMLVDWRSGRSIRLARTIAASATGALVGGLMALWFGRAFF